MMDPNQRPSEDQPQGQPPQDGDPTGAPQPPQQGGYRGYEAAPGAIEGGATPPSAGPADAQPPATPGPLPPPPVAQVPPTLPPAMGVAPPQPQQPPPPQSPYQYPGCGQQPQAPRPQGPQPPYQQQPAPPPGWVGGAPPVPPGPQPPPYGPPQGYGPAPQQGGWGPPPGPQWRPPGPPPGYGFAPPPKPRSRVLPIIVGLVVFVVLLTIGLTALLSSMSSGTGATRTGGFSLMASRIAVLNVNGVIAEGDAYEANSKKLVEIIRNWSENDSIKALVVRVNSPGGSVGATQEIYDALQDFRTAGSSKRPIVVSMGDVAASGGYYAAMAADHVMANEGTLTGSVGVIMSFLDYQGFQEKIGVNSRVVKSGEFKDMGSGSRAMTLEEKELLETMVLDVYDQFFEAVVRGRADKVRTRMNPTNPANVTDEEVEAKLSAYCDGRIMSGRQALEAGMIDEIGSLDDAIRKAAALANISPKSPQIVAPVRQPGLFGLGGLSEAAAGLGNSMKGLSGVRVEYRAEIVH